MPTLLISPWVSRNTIVHAPAGDVGTPSRPADNSQYEHSSISATLNELFGLQNLTRRDAWAASLLSLLDAPEPRTDAPMHLPEAPVKAALGGTHSCGPQTQTTRRQTRRVAHFAQVWRGSAVTTRSPSRSISWFSRLDGPA